MPVNQKIKSDINSQKQVAVYKEITRRLRIQNKKLMEQVGSLKEKMKQNKGDRNKIENQLSHFIKLNNAISGATGSCSDCWGENSECMICSGNGSPGWRNINRRLFNIYILPALEKLYHLSEKIK